MWYNHNGNIVKKFLLRTKIDRSDMVMACLKLCVFSMEEYLIENHMKIV